MRDPMEPVAVVLRIRSVVRVDVRRTRRDESPRKRRTNAPVSVNCAWSFAHSSALTRMSRTTLRSSGATQASVSRSVQTVRVDAQTSEMFSAGERTESDERRPEGLDLHRAFEEDGLLARQLGLQKRALAGSLRVRRGGDRHGQLAPAEDVDDLLVALVDDPEVVRTARDVSCAASMMWRNNVSVHSGGSTAHTGKRLLTHSTNPSALVLSARPASVVRWPFPWAIWLKPRRSMLCAQPSERRGGRSPGARRS